MASDDTALGDPRQIATLIRLMARLRDPDGGCPWDLEQDFSTIAPYTVEEAYEVADAIARDDLADLKDELGDLLFQVAFHSRLAEEQKAFAFEDVVAAIVTKMLRRHPHVFGAEDDRSHTGIRTRWEDIKAAEKAEKQAKPKSLLDDVPVALPALSRATKLQKRAARVGFDWPDTDQVFDKLSEETEELRQAIASGDGANQFEELGDLLFVYANLGRHLGLDPEAALQAANEKFRRRFQHIEAKLADDGRRPDQSDLAEMDALWDDAKAAEKAG